MNKIIQGDCLDKLKELEDNSIDSIVTDPPYELGFMGKSWDSTGIANNKDMWAECLRVLKPGGHLLAFSGTRTYHRMASAIEDAGFEVRDMIEWVYGSGFPKSLNIGKAVDKIAGEAGRKEKFTEWMRTTGITAGEINRITNSFMGSHYLTAKEQPAIPTAEIWSILRPNIKIEIPQWVDELVERIEREREVVGIQTNIANKSNDNTGRYNWNTENQIRKDSIDITKGTSEWEGWGTALKPSHEPICMARKPLSEKTVAENSLKWGTGGINIDESRVGTEEITVNRHSGYNSNSLVESTKGKWKGEQEKVNGRFPANLIHDNSEEVRECFPESNGRVGAVNTGKVKFSPADYGNGQKDTGGIKDSGNASRFFKSIIYQAKASKSERNRGCEGLEEKHKGTDLMVRTLWTNTERNHLSKVLSQKITDSNSICAEKYGFSPTLISFWKKGERIPTPETYEKLKNDYGLGNELDYIIYEHPKELTERTTILDNPTQTKSKNNHPTVKPIALMEYLIKMVTKPGGIVLDPFAGSGTTLVAAKKNGYNYIGIELTEDYIPIIKARLSLPD